MACLQVDLSLRGGFWFNLAPMKLRVGYIAFAFLAFGVGTVSAQSKAEWETVYADEPFPAAQPTAFDSVPPPSPGIPATDSSLGSPIDYSSPGADPPAPGTPAPPIESPRPRALPQPRRLPSSVSDAPPEPESHWRLGDAWAPRIRWEFGAEALWLERNISGVPLGFTSYNYNSPVYPTQPALGLYSNDCPFSLQTGLRLHLNAQLDDQRSFEGIFWGLQQWSTSDVVYGDPQYNSVLAYSPWLQMPSLINGLNDYLGYTYQSSVNNAEINQQIELQSYRYYVSYLRTSWLWGVRYLHLSDDLVLGGSDLEYRYAERLESRTTNDMVGLQTGLRFNRDWDRLQIITEGKIGLLANTYTQHGSDSSVGVNTPADFGAYAVSHSGTDLALLLELSIAARLQLSQSLWLRLGYQFYFISGMATAPRQLDGFDHTGSVWLDGLSLGLEAKW
jgi:hypothetical protein